MDNTIDFSNCDDEDDFIYNYVYNLIYDNYDTIIKNDEMYDAIKPSNNSYTRLLINNGHSERDAHIAAIHFIMQICMYV